MSGDGTPLGERIARLETEAREFRADIAELRTDVGGLKRFQAWLLGLGAGFGTLATLFAQSLRDFIARG